MNTTLHPQRAGRPHPWLYGSGLTAAALVLAILPAAGRCRAAWRSLRLAEATYAAKHAYVGRRPEIARRLEEREARMAALDRQLVTASELARVREAIVLAARASGCIVHATTPLEPRTLPRPDDDVRLPAGAAGSRPVARKVKAAARPEFVQWPVRVVVQGEYAQLVAMLERLGKEPTCLRITRLSLHPGSNCESLTCDFELAGYGLQPREPKSASSKGA